MALPALNITSAEKAFGGVQALKGVDLTVGSGEIVALLGENGAGKSTVIKLLAGVYPPDAGSFEVDGTALPNGFTSQDVTAAGVRFVHQDFGLIDTMSVMENMAFVAGFPKRNGLIDYAACAAQAQALLADLGLSVRPETLVGHLPHAEKAIIALARAMQGDAKVIVLDEVTAALPSPDAARVHASVRAAREKGIAFVYVSHRLEEVFDLCDRLVVLRDGRNIAAANVADVDTAQVINWIAGKTIEIERRQSGAALGETRLKADGLVGGVVTAPVSFELRAGEIVGVTGIIGSGYDTICEMVCGLTRPEAGKTTLDGNELNPGSTRSARDAGLEIVAGDRTRGAFPERYVRENLFADTVFRKDNRPDLAAERQRASELIAEYGVRPGACGETQIQSLSGGNQQKVLFARALMRTPEVIVLIDPTAGVDIGARSELHDMLRKAAARGAAIVFGSSDFEEILSIADRILVVRDGAIGASLEHEGITWDRLFAVAHAGHSHVEPA